MVTASKTIEVELNMFGKNLYVEFEVVGHAVITHYSKGDYWNEEEIDYDTELEEINIECVMDIDEDIDIELTLTQEEELIKYLEDHYANEVDNIEYCFD